MIFLKKNKLTLSTLLLTAAVFSNAAQANVVDIVINNVTDVDLILVSESTYDKFPTTIPAKRKESVTLYMGGTRSDIEVVYKRSDSGAACRFTTSHIEQVSGPYFDKSATSIGTPMATCSAYQTPTWRPPYNYKAEFAFYN